MSRLTVQVGLSNVSTPAVLDCSTCRVRELDETSARELYVCCSRGFLSRGDAVRSFGRRRSARCLMAAVTW